MGERVFASSRLRLAFFIFVSLLLITAASLKNGYFYDDEIYSIRSAATHGYVALAKYINQDDVHPPGSYLLAKFLFDVFGSWQAVKAVGGVLNALALATFGFLAFKRTGPSAPLAILLGLSATTVMWGASIRWYAYFNPLFAVTLGILLFSSISLTKRSALLVASSVVLLHLSYAALCAAPVLLVAHLFREKDNLRRGDILFLLLIGLLGLAVCIPQLRVFVGFLSIDNGIQTGSFLSALSQIAITMVVGNALFPVAVAPALYAALILGLAAYFLFVKPKSRLDWIVLAALLVGVATMVATGIAVKPRNSVYLLPLVFLLIASAVDGLPRAWRLGALAGIVIFQLLGVGAVVLHRGTIKGAFDADYNSALRTIEGWRRQCKGTLTVFHHDPSLDYMLEQNSIATSAPFKGTPGAHVSFAPGDCIVLVKTYHGYFDAATIDAIEGSMNAPALKQSGAAAISFDPNAAMKSRLSKESFPDHLIELRDYDVLAPVTLPTWPPATSQGADKKRGAARE